MTGLSLSQIMPPISVIFEQLAANLIAEGSKGVVLFATKNTDQTDSVDKFDFTDPLNITGVSDAIKAQVQTIFSGSPEEVIVVSYKTQFSDAASLLDVTSFDWLVCDDLAEQANVAAYGKSRKVKTVVYNQAADDMHVVNFVNPSVLLADGVTTKTGIQYVPRIGGALAGLPYSEDACALTFTDLKSVTLPADMEHGQLILYNSVNGVKVADPVNSLLTLTTNITEDMKSICIVEGMDRLSTDIKNAFEQSYKGRYKNKYHNQCLFISAVNYYYTLLAAQDILDPDYNNICTVDIEAQRALWIADGYDENNPDQKKNAKKWTDIQVKNNTYKNRVLLLNDVRFLDGMDSLQFRVVMM